MPLEQSGLAFVAQDIGKFLSDVSSGTRAVEGFVTTIERAQKQTSTYASAAGRAGQSIGGVSQQGQSAAKAFQALATATEKAQQIAALTEKIDIQKRQLGILQQELAAVATKYGDASLQAQKKQLTLDRLEASIRQNERAVDALANAEETFDVTAQDAAKSAQQLGKAADESAGGINILHEATVGAVRQIGVFAIEAAAQAGRALVQFGQDSIKVAGDFEAGMKRFSAAAGDALTEAGLKTEDFRKLFINVGKELPVSTGDVQEAAIELVKGGLDPMILKLGGLKDAINFAAAAELGLEESATIAVKQLGVWTDATASAEEQTKFLAMSQDLLVKMAGASTLDVDKLAKAMNIAGGQAKALNLDYRDFATGVTLISPAFNSAEEAGTSYKNFLARIQPSTDPATAAMQDLGLWTKEAGSAFFDAQGNYVGNAQAAELLRQATANLTPEMRASALQTIFGNDAMGAAVALAEAGAQGYDILSQKINQAAGVQAAAAAKQQGYNTAMDNFSGSMEALQITIGTLLLPVLTDLLNNVLTPSVNVLSDLASALAGDTEAFARLPASIQPVYTALEGIIGFVESVVGSFSTLPNVLGANSDALATLGQQAQAIATGALQSLRDAWINDILPAISTAMAFFQSDVVPILTDLASALLPVVGAALEVFAAVWVNILKPAMAEAWEFATKYVIPMLAVVADWLKKYLPPAVQAASGFLVNTFLPAIRNVHSFIQANLMPILEAIGKVLIAVVGKALEAVAGLWQKVLRPALDELWKLIQANVIPILKDAARWFVKVSGGLDGITKAVKTVVTWMGNLAKSISELDLPDWLTPGSPTPFEIAMYGLAESLGDVATEMGRISSPLQSVGQQAESLAAKVGSIPPSFRDMADAAGETGDDIDSAMGGAQRAVDALGKRLVEMTNRGFANLANAAEKAFETIENAIPPLLTPGSPTPFEIGLRGIVDALQAVTSEGLVFSDQMETVNDALREASGLITDAQEAMAGLRRQAAGNLDVVSNLGSGAIEKQRAGLQKEMVDLFDERGKELAKIAPERYGIEALIAQKEQELQGATDMEQIIQLQNEIQELQSQRQTLADKESEIIARYKTEIAFLSEQDAKLQAQAKTRKEIADEAERQLSMALEEANKLNDPRASKDYYAMRSKQIADLAQLQIQYAEAVAEQDAERMIRLSDQMLLIEGAQQRERAAAAERQKYASGGALTNLHGQVQEILNSITVEGDMPQALNDLFNFLGQIAAFMSSGTPGRASGGPVEAGSIYKVGERGWEYFMPQMSGSIIPHQKAAHGMFSPSQLVRPIASPQQMAQTTNVTYNQQRSITMPIHTNMTPAAIQQSAQITWALLP